MQLTHGLKRAVATNPNGAIRVSPEGRRSYREAIGRVARLAGGLRALGVAPGDRVGLLAFNSEFYLEALFVLPWCGAVAVPMNWRLTPRELAFLMEDAGVGVLIADAEGLALARRMTPRPAAWGRTVLIGQGGDGAADLVPYEDLATGAEPMADLERGGEDLAGLYYTAGTTSASKGVMLSHDNICANAINAMASLQFTEESIYLHSAPMFHLADGTSTFAITMMGGAHAYVPRFDPAACLAQIEACGVTNAQFVPTMIKMLLDHPDAQTRDLSSLRNVLYGASPIEDETLRRALTLLPNARFVHGYGMTEVSSIATMLPGKYSVTEGPHAAKRRSCGQAGLLCEVEVRREDGSRADPGEVGEIAIRGPNVMQGYWNRPEETAAALREGWMHSGDLGWLDEEGFLFLAGRLKDMIKTGGENVFAIEVENVIAEVPGVAESAVIGIPHPQWGETVLAIVVPRAGATVEPQAVIDFCRARLAPYKCPREVQIRTEPLPLSSAGKILKRDLRAPYWEGQGAG
ncbi:AMP-binding protein [Albimonas sp. CAU 1670]|uniref:class I adenylate-forming enzyme family protein n=1 Tax=Albimonas sp. CAU 1670 TaxID=3032599 RepID=UPI0023DC0435|nr:AMP-binding protein [Albimonas sp. CAU 1670]MDF2234793.1 AMP-binding protein [Albimonas sp. CAU 1670]